MSISFLRLQPRCQVLRVPDDQEAQWVDALRGHAILQDAETAQVVCLRVPG